MFEIKFPLKNATASVANLMLRPLTTDATWQTAGDWHYYHSESGCLCDSISYHGKTPTVTVTTRETAFAVL